MCGCTSTMKSGTQACNEHQGEWKKHLHSRSKQSLAGVNRMLQQPARNLLLKVLHSLMINRPLWIWKKTTQFIVDSYHYINHCTTDYICCKRCNTAPLNASAPNLVISAVDRNGQTYLKQAFNSQVQYSSLKYIFYNLLFFRLVNN